MDNNSSHFLTRLMKFSDLSFPDFNHVAWECIGYKSFLQIRKRRTFILLLALLLLDICLLHIVSNSTPCLYLKKQKIDCFQRSCILRKLDDYRPVGTLKNHFKRAVSIIKRQHVSLLNVNLNVNIHLWGHICTFTRYGILFAIICCHKLPFNATSARAEFSRASPCTTLTHTVQR